MAHNDEDLDLDTEAAAPRRGGALKKILLFSGIAALMIAVSITTTLLLVGGDGDPGAPTTNAEAGNPENGDSAAGGAEASKKRPNAKPLYLDLNPPFVVNLNDESGVRFLKVKVSVMAYEQDALDEVKENMPLVRHHLMLLFSSQKFADIRTREGKVALQKKALKVVRKALQQVTGKPLVEAVYLPSIVGQ